MMGVLIFIIIFKGLVCVVGNLDKPFFMYVTATRPSSQLPHRPEPKKNCVQDWDG